MVSLRRGGLTEERWSQAAVQRLMSRHTRPYMYLKPPYSGPGEIALCGHRPAAQQGGPTGVGYRDTSPSGSVPSKLAVEAFIKAEFTFYIQGVYQTLLPKETQYVC